MEIIARTNTGVLISGSLLSRKNKSLAIRLEKLKKYKNKKVTKSSVKSKNRKQEFYKISKRCKKFPICHPDNHPVLLKSLEKELITPPLWRNMHWNRYRVSYYQMALESMGPTIALSLNLSSELILKAQNSNRGLMDYIYRGIMRVLKRKLGRQVQCWLCLEANIEKTSMYVESEQEIVYNVGRPHIHGALQICPHEQTKAREALIKINKSCNSEFNRHAVYFKEIDDGPGWAVYSIKNLREADLRYFPGEKLISVTNKVRRVAKHIYDKDMIEFKKLNQKYYRNYSKTVIKV